MVAVRKHSHQSGNKSACEAVGARGIVRGMTRRAVVTGGFSYIGGGVARELVARSYQVHTLTNRREPEGTVLSSSPLLFEPGYLTEQLAGADVFINTYWIRLPLAGQSFETAVSRSRMLIEAAARAKVKRLVQVSVSKAEAGKNLGYYAGKAEVEQFVRQSGVSYAIVRPTLVVGPHDVLTNNIAWFLRHFPVFAVPGGGNYLVQPITLDDTARIIVDAAATIENTELDAAGPEVMTFKQYVRLVADACGLRRRIVRMPRWMVLGVLRLVGLFLRDIVLTREEILGLEQELLVSSSPPLGQASVPDWLAAHGRTLGHRYVNDIHRHFGAGADLPIRDRSELG